MDINILRSIATVLLFIGFLGMCLWVYSGKRRAGYKEAANLPFADDDISKTRTSNNSEPDTGEVQTDETR